MNTTTNAQSQKEQLSYSYAIGYMEKPKYDGYYATNEHYDCVNQDGFDTLEECQDNIKEHLTLYNKHKKVFKIEIWISAGDADEYDEIEFKQEDLGYTPNGKVTRVYGKKIEEEEE